MKRATFWYRIYHRVFVSLWYLCSLLTYETQIATKSIKNTCLYTLFFPLQRYFVLDKGILIYGKGPTEINRGKIHGSVDIGLSVISSKSKRRRIDIDAEEFIYHLKAKTEDAFVSWVKQLTIHRLYRQHILTYGAKVGLIARTANEIECKFSFLFYFFLIGWYCLQP